jgi:hypothetical protein
MNEGNGMNPLGKYYTTENYMVPIYPDCLAMLIFAKNPLLHYSKG